MVESRARTRHGNARLRRPRHAGARLSDVHGPVLPVGGFRLGLTHGAADRCGLAPALVRRFDRRRIVLQQGGRAAGPRSPACCSRRACPPSFICGMVGLMTGLTGGRWSMSTSETEKIVGLLIGRENTFPGPFIETVNRKGASQGVRADMASLGGAREIEPQRYAVIVDRISHEVPYYRAHLKSAAVQGTVVVNDPFWWEADEKFFECTLARELGVAVPKTVVLPNKSYIPDISDQSLRNLQYPLDWDSLIEYTGLPAILKPNTGGGWKDVYRVDSKEELIWAYDQSGGLSPGYRPKTMILQEFIKWEDYIRCIAIGRKDVLPIRYDPTAPFHERYVTSRPVEGDLRTRAILNAIRPTDALGYDMDTVEFAVRDGELYAIDWLNPAPDFDSFSIKEANFAWVLEKMSDLVIAYATGQGEPPWKGEHRWWRHVR